MNMQGEKKKKRFGGIVKTLRMSFVFPYIKHYTVIITLIAEVCNNMDDELQRGKLL